MKLTPDLARAMEAAGLGNLRSQPKVKPPVAEIEPPGELIVEFVVEGRPTPWKAPTVTKAGLTFKDKTLVKWQSLVAATGKLAMGSRYPYPGPVELRLHFELTRRAGSVPDLSNLTKAFEDSLQGAVIVNDRCVFRIRAERTMGEHDRATVEVRSLGELP